MAKSTNYIKAKNEALRTYDTSGGDSTFQAIGDPLQQPARMIKFKNDSDEDVTISYNGTDDHDIILAGDREIEDLCTNRTIDEGMYRKQGTQIYASSAAGTGNFYVVVIYTDKT